MTESVLICANYPGRETGLRCNRYNKPICASFAVQTPVGYRELMIGTLFYRLRGIRI
jgi:hypothetical protein